jgi:hypothetical protein
MAALTLCGAAPEKIPGPGIPWRGAGVLAWQMGLPAPPPPPYTTLPTQSYFDLTVRMQVDGALRITDAKGIIRLRTGLPGRPQKAWRDWGTPVERLFEPLGFSSRSPLQRGIGGMPVGAADFRSALEGLLWILDDDETVLTVIHPATAQVVYLPLPGGQGLTLAFLPDRLEVHTATTGKEPATAWSLNWLALLPQFVQLGQDKDANRVRGTALLPFPRE